MSIYGGLIMCKKVLSLLLLLSFAGANASEELSNNAKMAIAGGSALFATGLIVKLVRTRIRHNKEVKAKKVLKEALENKKRAAADVERIKNARLYLAESRLNEKREAEHKASLDRISGLIDGLKASYAKSIADLEEKHAKRIKSIEDRINIEGALNNV
jgi:hypothetical protein